MANLYSNNFEANTVGSPIPSWTTITGFSGPYLCTATNPVHGAQSIAFPVPVSANAGQLYTGASATSNMDVIASSKVIESGVSGNPCGIWARADVANTNGYLFYVAALAIDASTVVNLLNASNAFASMGSVSQMTAFGRLLVVGDIVWTRIVCQGTSVKAWAWLDGTAQPATPTISATDTFNTISGFGGVHAGNSETSGTYTDVFDDFSLNDLTSLNSGVPINTAIGNTTAANEAPGASGGTGPYTYQWYRSTTTGFTPGGGNIVAGATSLVLSDTGLSAGTQYYYKLVSTDSLSATVISVQLAALTTGGSASFAVSPSTSTNAQSVTYTLTGTSTSWTSGTTFGISGVTGASITAQSVNAGAQTGSVTILLDNTHTGTLTFTDSTDSATATSAITLAGPGIPRSPSCTPGNTQNVLAWLAPNTGGLTATYNVYRGTTPGGESGTPIATGITALTYTDTGLTNGQIYYYKIAAVNATATGSLSAEVFGTPAATGVGNLTSQQALAALGVLAHSIQAPFLYNNATNMLFQGSQLVIPLSSGNLALGAALVNGADSNNVYLGLVEGDAASGLGTSNSANGSSGVSGGGAGGLSAAQFLAALGALMLNVQPPFQTTNQTGVFFQANQLVIPLSSANIALGSGLVLSTDNSYVYISLNPGDPR